LKLPIGIYESVIEGQNTAPVEIVSDIQGKHVALIPVTKLNPGEELKIQIRPGTADTYPKRTYAELSHKEGNKYVAGTKYEGDFFWVKPNQIMLPGTFRNHSYYLKYEGPGWENDKVSFRFYLDDRNIIDVNGKKTSSIVLPAVGVDNFDSYHKMALWGMDNMRVGKALGLGTIACWDGAKTCHVDTRDSTFCAVVADGKLRSQIKTIYYGWETGKAKSTLTSLISLDAGSRASKVELLLENPAIQLATGIIKDKSAEYITPDKTDGEWTYIATFGKQSLNDDNQGLAVFAKKSQIEKITTDELNYVIVFKAQSKQIEYYIMPTWELDKEPVATKNDFLRCIGEVLNRLNNSLKIKLK
jgi:regulatory protein YycH of two-component signal transduction system YycFG